MNFIALFTTLAVGCGIWAFIDGISWTMWNTPSHHPEQQRRFQIAFVLCIAFAAIAISFGVKR